MNETEWILFVLDRDQHANYTKAITKIDGLKRRKVHQKKCIHIITSTPCFEFWLMLHGKKIDKPYTAASDLIKDLKAIEPFQNYQKGSADYFDEIIQHMNSAIKNSEEIIKQGKLLGFGDHEINPATYMHKLVQVLKEISDHNNKKRV